MEIDGFDLLLFALFKGVSSFDSKGSRPWVCFLLLREDTPFVFQISTRYRDAASKALYHVE